MQNEHLIPRMGESEQLIILAFRPLWKHVNGIREFCDFFTKITFDNRALGERVGLVVHELTENAIKYSRSDDSAELQVAIRYDNEHIEVEVANSPDPKHLEALRRAFEELGATSAEEAYVGAMKRAASLPSGESGLGLSRTRFEAAMDLALTVDNGLARVVATGSMR